MALDVEADAFATAVLGLVASGFAGANVTTPHKLAAAELADSDVPSVNTLVFDDGVVRGYSTDAAILEELDAQVARDPGRRRHRDRVPAGAAERARLRAAGRLAA